MARPVRQCTSADKSARSSPGHSGRRRADPSEASDLKAWHIIVLLALTHYGVEFAHARWFAFTSGLGAICAYFFWHVRGKRWSLWWIVCMWGIGESLQVFICQAWGATKMPDTKQFEGMCDAMTGFPFFTLGLMMMAAVAALWLDSRKR